MNSKARTVNSAPSISFSSKFITSKRLITAETRKEMKKVLTEIQDGTFASEFLTEMSPNGGRKVHFLAKRRMEAELPIEKVGAELRGMMSWLKK